LLQLLENSIHKSSAGNQSLTLPLLFHGHTTYSPLL
jgi:hypothetical protein